jgi:hypothetical protein
LFQGRASIPTEVLLMSPRARTWFVPSLVIVAAPLILFAPLIFTGRVLYWGTTILQFAEWRQLVGDALRSGHFPLWTDAVGNGFPLLANLQSAVLYPFNVLFLAFPVERALGYSVILHLMLAGGFMYGYARHLELNRPASLVAALSYSLSAFLVSRAQFPSMVSCAAWLPLLFWLTDRVVDRRRVADALLLGLVIAIQFFAGHAQLWYYGLWALALYTLYRGTEQFFNSENRRSSRAVWGTWALMLFAVVVGGLAAAAQLLPTAELARWSQRAGGAGTDYAMTYSFWPWRLITLAVPDFFGNPAWGDFWGYGNYWEDAGYIGLLPLLLALAAIAVWLRRHNSRGATVEGQAGGAALSRVPFFAVLAVAALTLALGRNLPIYPFVFRHVPGFGLFQAPARFLYWYTFAGALLAGVGLHHLGQSPVWVRASRYLMALAFSLLMVVILAQVVLPALPRPSFASSLTRFAVLAVASALIILWYTHNLISRRPLVRTVGVVALVLVDLLTFGVPLNPTADANAYHAPTAAGSYVRAQAKPGEPFRLFSFQRYVYDTMFDWDRGLFDFRAFVRPDAAYLGALRESLLPNLNVIESLDSANNYDPLPVGHAQALLDRADALPKDQAYRLLRLMNVRYIVDDAPLPGLPPAGALQTKIYELPGYLPRAYCVFQAKVVPGADAQLSALLDPDFDPSREVILSAAVAALPSAGGHMVATVSAGEARGNGDSATVDSPGGIGPAPVSLQYGPNRVTMDAALPQPGYLVLLDTYYPSWQALVDGQPQPVIRANYAFRAVALSAGRHRVEFVYRPSSFWAGLSISGLTWLVTVVAWITLSRWKPRS